MKRPHQHVNRAGFRLGFVVRDPGDYEGRHRLLEGHEAEHQFYPGGCPSCLYRVTS